MTMSNNNNIIAITGANGFIGKYLVDELSKNTNISLRLLVRNAESYNNHYSNVTLVEGDLTRLDSLGEFLISGCTVINLAYNFGATSEQNIIAAKNLFECCKKSNVKRLIHCSTAAVYGRAPGDIMYESSECLPLSTYGKTKLFIEKIFNTKSEVEFEFVNIRPTAVYGNKGPALMKLINNLENGNNFMNYMRSCLFNLRALNLVHVSNLVAAIIFLVEAKENIGGETYNISEDFEVDNNYKYVEDYLRRRLSNKGYLFPIVSLPLLILSFILRLLGRDSVNPRMRYNTDKIKKIGFEYKMSLDSGLDELIEYYKQSTNQS